MGRKRTREEEKPYNQEQGVTIKKTCIEAGDEAQRFVRDLLRQSDAFENVEMTTTGHKLDVSYTVKADGRKRGLQVKHLYRRKQLRGCWTAKFTNKYLNDTLIVCINVVESKAVLFFGQSSSSEVTQVYYGEDNKPKPTSQAYGQRFIVAWSEFPQRLCQMAKQSTLIENDDDFIPPAMRLEKDMTDRFLMFLQRKGVKDARRNDSQGDATDIFIGNLKLQLKSCSFKHGSAQEAPGYSCSMQRGKPKNVRAYAKGENHFYVFEIGNVERLKGQFCIIPETALLEHRILSDATTGQKGRRGLGIYPLEFKNQAKALKLFKKGGPLRGNWTCDPQYWFNDDSSELPFRDVALLDQ